MGVYVASLTRLVLLGAGPCPIPPPPSVGNFGEEDGKESFLRFFKVLIFVMVFSMLFGFKARGRSGCAMLL